MKKVCLFHFPRMESFYGYSIDTLDPLSYFPGADSWWRRRLILRKLSDAKFVDGMYRERDRCYLRFLDDFVDKFQDADLIIFSTYNPVHPEILCTKLKKPIKVLGFVDHPVSTYIQGLAYLWAFDAAFYISHSYSDRFLFRDFLEHLGCHQSYWWPLVPPAMSSSVEQTDLWPLAAPRAEEQKRGDSFFRSRDLDLIYVGGFYDPKVDRLIRLRKHFGSRMHIYGRWPLLGCGGMTRPLLGKPAFWGRVRSISQAEKTALYYRAKIGFNMHFSETPMETCNMRMYEVPAHGMMLLCDKGALNAHAQIFQPDKEAVFYDSIEDAIEKVEYYLRHDEERERIARAGFARVHREYDGELGLKNLLDWASGLHKKDLQCQNGVCGIET